MPQLAMVIGLLLGLLGFMFDRYTVAVESRVKFEVAAVSEKMTREYQEKTASMSQDNANDKAEFDAEILRQSNQYSNEINAMRATYEKDLREKPLSTGDDFQYRLDNIMCKIAADNNQDRKACNLPSGASYSPDKSIVVTVTAETADQWAEQCEAGLNAYCEYAIVGLTAQGALTVVDWLNDIDRYQQQLNVDLGYYNNVIDDITKPDE